MKSLKKTYRGWLPLLVFTLLITVSSLGQNNALFDQGKQQYKAGNFEEAIQNWTKIINSGNHSAALYFNIANAEYKLNRIGPSIYYYEKALQLDPGDSEILNNLGFAQNATIDAIEPLPQTIFARWDKTLSSWLTFDGWAWVAVICALLFALLFIAYYFSIYTLRKRMLFIGSVLSFMILIVAFIMSFRTFDRQLNDQPAIIFAESANIKAEPSNKSETSFVLHEGTKVQIIETDDEWSRVLLADGKDGWISNADFKAL